MMLNIPNIGGYRKPAVAVSPPRELRSKRAA
jgi:hypothetical protein